LREIEQSPSKLLIISLIISGVPQVSVLGPIFFLLYVGDVTLVYPCSVRCKLFADDLKIYSNVDSSCASLNLHKALRQLEHWYHMWQLQVNLFTCKTSVVHLGANNPRVSYSFNYCKQETHQGMR